MKTFADLEFKSHPGGDGKIATMNFPNGYGISVVRFKINWPESPPAIFNGLPKFLEKMGHSYGSHTNNDDEWEIAVLKDGHLCYTTPITSDVIGYLNENDVTKIMKEIQKLPRHEGVTDETGDIC